MCVCRVCGVLCCAVGVQWVCNVRARDVQWARGALSVVRAVRLRVCKCVLWVCNECAQVSDACAQGV